MNRAWRRKHEKKEKPLNTPEKRAVHVMIKVLDAIKYHVMEYDHKETMVVNFKKTYIYVLMAPLRGTDKTVWKQVIDKVQTNLRHDITGIDIFVKDLTRWRRFWYWTCFIFRWDILSLSYHTMATSYVRVHMKDKILPGDM